MRFAVGHNHSIRAHALALGGRVLDLVYPPVCAGCGTMTGSHRALCPACWSSVRFLEEPWCCVTGMPFDHDRGEGLISAEAIADPPPFGRVRSAVFHDGVARRLAHRLKYGDRGDLASMMAAMMVRAGAGLIADADVLVAVPLHRGRLFSRRFNQSAELARALSRLVGVRFLPGAIVRTRATERQVGLGLKARERNVNGAFAIDPAAQDQLSGRHVLLIDDVFTTGSTVRAVTRALRRGGVAGVDVLTFSRVASADRETLYA